MFDSFCDSNSIQFCSEVAEWQRDLAALTPDAPRAESLTADPKQLADPALANPEARDATAVLDALAEQVFDSVQFKFCSILRASNRRADVRPTGAAARVRTEWELNRIAQARLLELGAHPAQETPLQVTSLTEQDPVWPDQLAQLVEVLSSTKDTVRHPGSPRSPRRASSGPRGTGPRNLPPGARWSGRRCAQGSLAGSEEEERQEQVRLHGSGYL